MYTFRHIKCVMFSDFNQNGNTMTNRSKNSLIKVYKNPSSGRRTISCERTDGQSKKHAEDSCHFLQLLANAPNTGRERFSLRHIN
jgi:hypothetical protein